VSLFDIFTALYTKHIGLFSIAFSALILLYSGIAQHFKYNIYEFLNSVHYIYRYYVKSPRKPGSTFGLILDQPSGSSLINLRAHPELRGLF